MSKHTPGPWKVIRDGNDLSVRSANSRDTGKITHLDIAENIGGLRPGPDFTDRSEAKANARLIAAAPELLAELEMLSNIVEGCGMATMPEVECRLVFARAAITKAKGE